MPSETADSILQHEFLDFVRDVLADQAADDRGGLPDSRLRRDDVAAVLAYHEEEVRRVLPSMREARAAAVWEAVWQLRKDVVDAVDRCTQAERDARWARED